MSHHKTKYFTSILYVNPRDCVHRQVQVKNIADMVIAVCKHCRLEGTPIHIGRWQWWSRARATRAFYKIANLLDKSLIIALLLLSSCSAHPTFYGTDTETTVDTEIDDTEIEIDTETDQLDTDTDTDTETDTYCPWECKELAEPEPTFTCDNYKLPAGPDSVRNYNLVCPNPTDVCCQPWPPIDIGLDEYCMDIPGYGCFLECEKPDFSVACYNAVCVCCPERHS